ncbi:MAG: SDR family oxidoreductase [Deltaproteobacteria bacterium]|nr:SDR family oxidoreductase [Deltaproteobacteria bacterium]
MTALSVGDTLRGKELLLIGATGFLGKVLLATLLRQAPEIGRVTCLIRRGRDGRSAADRFQQECLSSPVFASLRAEGKGENAAGWTDRIRVVEGDITEPTLGLSTATTEEIAQRIDLVCNVSGLVNFNPPLPDAFATNVNGARQVAKFAANCRNAALLHVSTCFVVGRRSGEFAEKGSLSNWCPAGTRFDHAKEIATIAALCRRDASAQATEVGLNRAQIMGWPNIYTYTKALGEQAVAATGELAFAIVRPAIVESAISFPEPGWNEGINTSAPLAYLGLLGQARYPCGDGVVLDVIPVDYVANALAMIGAALLRGEAKPCYQLGSSDTKPLLMTEAIELTGLFKRRFLSTGHSAGMTEGLGMPKWLRALMAQWEAVPVSADHFRRFSAPRIRERLDAIDPWLQKAITRGPLPLRALARPLREAGRALQKLARRSETVFTQYLPFIHDHVYRFRCDGIRQLRDRLSSAERSRWPWSPETIDWRHYWIDIHLAGLARHVFPQMTARLQGKSGRQLLPNLSFLVPMPIPEGLKLRDLRVPAPVRAVLKRGFGEAQEWLYAHFFQTTVTGRGHIPANRNILVVANHCSHLDMGLIKYALGPYGRRLRALAAKDYFFRDGIRRIFFGNFTNLIPIDRSADLKESLKPAIVALQQGEVVLMFPEGTRTVTGEMGRFRRGVGYLALAAGVDVLPIHVTGTFTAIPKGRLLIPRHRRIGARIGPVIPHAELRQAVAGLPPDEAYRAAATLIETAVRQLLAQRSGARVENVLSAKPARGAKT